MPPQTKIPEHSKALIFLALLFVPGLYVVLLSSLAVVLGLGGGLVYALIMSLRTVHSGRLIVLAVLVGCGVVLGAISVIKGIICSVWPHRRFEPGIIIELRNEPNLGYLLAPLCSKLDTRLPDAVILHAEPGCFVTQGKVGTFNGTARGRILAISLPKLAAMTKNELRATLAHELAHFSGGDTLYSTMVMPVYKGAETAWMEMTEHIERAESFSEKIPMLLPRAALGMYLSAFHCIDIRIRKVREARADMISCMSCGTKSFRQTLMKAAGIGMTFFDERAWEAARQAYSAHPFNYHIGFRMALPQLYAIANDHCARAMAELDDPRDPHPCLKVRLDSVPDIPERYSDTDPALSLLTNLAAYEKVLGETYTAAVTAAGQR